LRWRPSKHAGLDRRLFREADNVCNAATDAGHAAQEQSSNLSTRGCAQTPATSSLNSRNRRRNATVTATPWKRTRARPGLQAMSSLVQNTNGHMRAAGIVSEPTSRPLDIDLATVRFAATKNSPRKEQSVGSPPVAEYAIFHLGRFRPPCKFQPRTRDPLSSIPIQGNRPGHKRKSHADS